MERSGKTTIFPSQVTVFIEPEGTVTITSLYVDLLPIAFSLNPEDERIKEFIFYQKFELGRE
jgi:hypothetical protein